MLDEVYNIEELLKSERLAKAVDRTGLKTLFHYLEVYHHPSSPPEMKAKAKGYVDTILAGGILPPPNKRERLYVPRKTPTKSPSDLKPLPPNIDAQAAPKITPIPPAPKLEMPKDLHLTNLNTGGHDEAGMRNIFNALPDEHKTSIISAHKEASLKKSVDKLLSLFEELKKHT